MICAHCAYSNRSGAEVCEGCGESPLLDGRYRLDAILGQGASGITYRATRLADDVVFAIKELPFRRIDSLKTKALFHREAQVLRQLDHSGIPKYVDDFTAGGGKNLSLYLVQEFIDGQTLDDEQKEVRYAERDVLEILCELAEILGYLQGREPPIIHRDIKPKNVMRRAADGRLVLLDFGSVRDAVEDPKMGGSTVAGTFGYMAPEQFGGHATPATDLYALGVLAVVLLSRRTADSLVDTAGRLEWQPFVDVEPETKNLLSGLLTQDMTQRARWVNGLEQHIRQAIDAIDNPASPVSTPTPVLEPEVSRTPSVSISELSAQYRPSLDQALQSKSGSTGKSSNWVVIGSIILVLVVTVMGLAIHEQMNPSVKKPVGAETVSECPTGECAPIPTGLKGLRFGMSRGDVEERFPSLKGVPDMASKKVSVSSLYSAPFSLRSQSSELPGFVLPLKTTIGGLDSGCELEFAVADSLSKMTCTLEPLPSRSAHEAAETILLKTLKTKYGNPKRTSKPKGPQFIYDETKGSWAWTSSHAELTLKSHFRAPISSTPALATMKISHIVVTNVGANHLKVVSQLKKALRQKAAQKRLEARQKKKQKRRESLRKIRNNERAFGEDL